MITIGLTGGIGAGKSLVSEMLAAKGAALVNADQVGHRSYLKGTPTYERLVAEFGADILDADGQIDRARLGPRVFADPKQRERLNAIVWPAMAGMMEEDLRAFRADGVKVAVLEAAVLIEAGWASLANEVWMVLTEPETAIARLQERGLSRDQAEARIRSQLTNDERRWYADVIIENSGTVAELRAKVDAEWHALQRRLVGAASSSD